MLHRGLRRLLKPWQPRLLAERGLWGRTERRRPVWQCCRMSLCWWRRRPRPSCHALHITWSISAILSLSPAAGETQLAAGVMPAHL